MPAICGGGNASIETSANKQKCSSGSGDQTKEMLGK
jgi:hypothetical protein